MNARIILCVGLAAALCACERRSKLSDPEPSDAELFAGCEQQLSGSAGRIYQCGSLIAQVQEAQAVEARALLDSALAIPRFYFYGNSTEERAWLELGGSAREVVKLTGQHQGRDKLVLAVVVSTEEHGARLGLCMADAGSDNERRCQRMLAYFVQQGSLDGAIGSQPALDPPAFVGKPLMVPEGCELRQSNAGGGAIHCDGGAAILQWQVASDPVFIEQWVEQKRQAYRAEFDQVIDGVPELMSETFDCTIDGVAARCELMMIGTSAWVYLGHATVRGLPAAVLCSHVGPDPYPAPVCNDLIH